MLKLIKVLAGDLVEIGCLGLFLAGVVAVSYLK